MSSIGLVTVYLIVICAVGLLYCFRGYKSLKWFMILYGLYSGFSLIMSLYGEIGGLMWILALGVGIVLALLAFLFLKVAMFLAGGLLGLLIYQAAAALNPAMTGFLTGLIFFAVAGAVTVAAKRPLIIIGTAFYGAYTFTEALGILLGVLTAGTMPASAGLPQITTALRTISVFNSFAAFIPWLITILLGIVGAVRQFRSTRKGGAKR